jgi:alkaline phosphatase D
MSSSRRQFVTAAGMFGAAAVFAPQSMANPLPRGTGAKLLGGGKFSDGVASGDPLPTSIVLWTRLAGANGSGQVELEVAKDKSFRHVVARKNIATSSKVNHAVKARVSKLKPHTQYYYRFSAKGAHSDVGRFRTALPADSNEPVKFAYWSCSDYTHGYYNAYEHLAGQDIDFMVCLGDYIYDETYHSIADKTGVRNDPIGKTLPGYPSAIRAAISLSDYRKKYSLYRSDKSLRKLHAKFPMVTLWDDHEVMDNYAGGEKDGGLPAGYGYTTARKLAGYKAWGESMPTFGKGSNGNKIYRKLQFGKNVDMIVMDQRQYRANQPCDDAVAKPCADWDEPRAFLGKTQMNWVKSELKKSKANWKVMANELMIMPTEVTGGNFFTFDSWQGYPQERAELLNFIKNNSIKDVMFVTGDIHTFITGQAEIGFDGKGTPVATELVGGSITSAGRGETDLDAGGGVVIKGNDQNPSTPASLINALRSINPWVDVADFDHHGYGLVTASKTTFDTQMVRMSTVKQKTIKTESSKGWHWKIPRGGIGTKGYEA